MSSEGAARLGQTVAWAPDKPAGLPLASSMAAIAAAPRTRVLGVAALGLATAWIVASSALSAWRSFDHDLTIATRAPPLPVAAAAPAAPRFMGVDPRRAALMELLGHLRAASTTPGSAASGQPATATSQDPQRLLGEAEFDARRQAGRLDAALKLTGARMGKGDAGAGPLAANADPRTLSTLLGVDEAFAVRIRDTAREIGAVRAMDAAVSRLPLSAPVQRAVLSSGFGVRADPFTEAHAFHAGQDFAGGYMTPVSATAPGVVSFTGDRSGYGHTVEVDHGGGYKTRYAHLAAIGVRVGQAVVVGSRLGGMGSTGRSTGVHLHYEVWVQGRVQDPARFLRAGEMLGPTVAGLGLRGGETGSVQLASSGALRERGRGHRRHAHGGGRVHARFGG